MKGFSTKAIHGTNPNSDIFGSIRPPVYDSVSFEFKSSEDIENAFAGRKSAHSYSRISNPTVAEFEERISAISGALGTVAVSSGMAAISTALIAIARPGDNIITSKNLFGNTFSLLAITLREWGLEIRFADLNSEKEISGSIDGNTRAIYFETITNPQLEVADPAHLSKISKANSIALIADSTATTPYLLRTGEHGIDIELISTTKYISGGAPCVGGAIIDNGTYDWSNISKFSDEHKKYGKFVFLRRLRREVFRNLGTCLSPHNASMHLLGLETLQLRIERSCSNAMDLALYLEKKQPVKSVNYPGLKKNRFHNISKRIFNGRFGGIVTFELGSKQECFDFMDALKIIKRATNIHDNRTLVIHPASTIYCEYTAEEKRSMGISENMVRLSAGIEDIEDLKYDIDMGLERIK